MTVARLLTPTQIIQSGGAYIMINSIEGAMLTCGSATYTLTAGETYHIFVVSPGTYVCTARYGDSTVTDSVTVVTGAEITLIPSVIPVEYQQVEYLRFSGDQYINTGIVPTNMEATIKIYQSSFVSNAAIFGTSGGSLYYHITTFANQYFMCNGTSDYGYGGWTSGLHEIVYNKISGGGCSIDGQVVGVFGVPQASDVLLLGSRANAYMLQGDVYYFKLTNTQSGTAAFEGYPCYRKSDSVAGLYDTVSGTLFTNTGTGSFVVGADV